MESLVSNPVFNSGKARRVTGTDGRDYLVAPVSILVPGVLNGSEGPLYYPPEECSKDVHRWDGMPLVVYHPTLNGTPVSAATPGVLDRQGCGFLDNTTFKDKTRSEGWFDIERCDRIDKTICSRLVKGEKIEVSTGLVVRVEPVENGSYNGRPYKGIARDIVPDHLAVLPDQVGACSIKDGCGVLNNVTKKDGDKTLSASDYAYVPDPQSPSTWKLRIDDAAHVGAAIAALGKGFRGRKVSIPRSALPGVKAKVRRAWKKFHKGADPSQVPAVIANRAEMEVLNPSLVVNPYPNEHAARVADPGQFKANSFRRKSITSGVSVIVAKRTSGGPMVVQSYRFDARKFTAQEARKWLRDHKITARLEEATGKGKVASNTAQGTDFIDNGSTDTGTQETDMATRTENVLWLTTNCDCWKEPSSKPDLDKLSDAQVQKLRTNAEKARRALEVEEAVRKGFGDQALVGNAEEMSAAMMERCKKMMAEQKAREEKKEGEPMMNQGNNQAQTQTQTQNSSAPRLTAEEQEDLAFARAEKNRQKQGLVERLTANVADPAQKQQHATFLMQKPLGELQTLAALMPVPTLNQSQTQQAPNFSGGPSWAGAAVPPGITVGNDADGQADVLPMPGFNWDQDSPLTRKKG